MAFEPRHGKDRASTQGDGLAQSEARAQDAKRSQSFDLSAVDRLRFELLTSAHFEAAAAKRLLRADLALRCLFAGLSLTAVVCALGGFTLIGAIIGAAALSSGAANVGCGLQGRARRREAMGDNYRALAREAADPRADIEAIRRRHEAARAGEAPRRAERELAAMNRAGAELFGDAFRGA